MNVGLIGCGEISQIHMIAYKRLENINVIAVSDIMAEKAKKFANQWGIKKVFMNHKDLLEIKELDFVDVCTPVSTHASISIDAAKAGINILLEKPMALSSEECEKIINETKKRGVSLCVNHHALFYSSIKKAKALVDSGYFDLQQFYVSFYKNFRIERLPDWAYRPENGGLLWEVCTHPAYILLFFLQDIKDVYAVGEKSNSVYDNFLVLSSSSHDSFGLIDCCFTSNERKYACQITSRNGNRAEIDIPLNSFIDKSKFIRSSYKKFFKEAKDLLRSWTKSIFRAMYHRQKEYEFINTKFLLAKAYVESLQNDSVPPVTPEQGRDTIKLLECVSKSLETGEVVQFK